MPLKNANCYGCPLQHHSRNMTDVEGLGELGVLVVAEASGEMEDRDSLPLRPFAPAGGVFERTLRRLGIDRQQLSVTNLCRCKPTKNLLSNMAYESQAVQSCRPNLEAAYFDPTRPKPKVILALGNLPFSYLTGHGATGMTVSHLRGYVFKLDANYSARMAEDADLHNVVVVPTYHPSHIRRGATELFGVFARDVMRAVRIARGEDFSFILDDPLMAVYRDELQYELHPSLDEAWAAYRRFRDAPDQVISYDLETAESASLDEDAREQFSDTRIRQIQFTAWEASGIALPWAEGYREVAAAILKLPNPKVGWNCFHKNTSVWMADGSWKPIHAIKAGDLVRSKHGTVIVNSRVTSRVNVKDGRPWMEVCVDGAYNRGAGRWGNPGVICTGDHEWFTPEGKKEAYLLRRGDEVFLPRLGHSDVISGTLHGDGHANRRGGLSIQHSNKEWAKAKADHFGVKLNSHIATRGFDPGSVQYSLNTTIPKYWRSRHYGKSSRIWYPVSDRALAVWYSDDGTLGGKLKKNPVAQFAIQKFSPKEKKKILAWFGTEFGPCSLYRTGNLALSVEASGVFFGRISGFIHPSMQYKLPSRYRGNYDGWMNLPYPQIGIVEEIRKAVVDVRYENNKYCLEVESNHSFFTRAGLVSNCRAFDDRVLRVASEQAGQPELYMPRGTVHDGMLMWKRWQPELPANLQYASSFTQFPFPWKHLSGQNLPFYGCLTGESRIMMADGSAKKIMDIVRKKCTDPVMGMDESGNPISVNIVDWHSARVVGQQWKKIKVESVCQPLYLTPDHKIWSSGRWIEAGNIKSGDEITVHTFGSDDLIHGSLLGDGSCDRRGRFTITHCEDQREYFESKRLALNGPLYTFDRGEYGIGYRTETWISPTRWRSKFYPDGKRIFSPPSNAALAIWYMDDGCLAKAPISGGQFTLSPRISCQKPNSDEALDWLRRQFGRVSLYRDNRGGQGGSFGFTGEAKELFFSTIAAYIHPSMDHKIPVEWRGQYNGWLAEMKHQTSIVSEVSDYDPGEHRRDLRYCITVDHPTHRFFAMGGLVKNCADSDAAWRNFHMMHRSMTAQSMWQPYLDQVVKLHDLPAQVAKTGLGVSAEVAEATVAEMEAAQDAILVELEKIYPESERTWEPEEGYKKTPKAVEERKRLWVSERLGILIGERTVGDGEGEMEYVRRITGMVEREFWAKVKNPATLMMDKQLVRRWCKPKPISIHSRPQIIRYAKSKKHEIPSVKDAAGEARESLTLADLELMYGRTRDRFYGLVAKSRKIGEEKKVLADLKYEAMLLRGRIHPVFAISPTGELASKSPGLPQPQSLAIKCVVAGAGKVFVRWSWPGQRDRVLASLAGIAAADRLPFVADERDIHRVAMEGFLVGESDRAVLEANRSVFGTSLKTVMQQRERFRKLWPEVARWQEQVRQRAHRQNYLLNRFGEIRWFYEVYAPDGKGGMRLGDQAVAAGRFIAETEAAGAMRWRLGRLGIEKNYLVAMARDWLVFEVTEGDVASHVKLAYRKLAEVPEQLEGVVLPMVVEVGRNWLEMQELKVMRK